MKYVSLISVLLLTSCSQFIQNEKIPGWDNVRMNYEYFPKEDVSFCLFYGYLQFQKTFGDDDKQVYNAFNNVSINWESEIKTGYEKEDEITTGLTTDRHTIHLLEREGRTLAQSSLFHEMVHIVLWNLYGSGDADHEFGKGPWGWANYKKPNGEDANGYNDYAERTKIELQQMGY